MLGGGAEAAEVGLLTWPTYRSSGTEKGLWRILYASILVVCQGAHGCHEETVISTPPYHTGWKLGTAFYGQASVRKMSASQLKALDEAAGKAREAGAPVLEPGSLAAQVRHLVSRV